VYIYASCFTDFKAAREYFYSTSKLWLSQAESTLWIRRSTGRLCADPIPSGVDYWYNRVGEYIRPQEIKSLDVPNLEATVIEFRTLEEYHEICYWNLSQTRSLSTSTLSAVNLGAIILCSSGNEVENGAEITTLQNIRLRVYENRWSIDGRPLRCINGKGWTYCTSGDVLGTKIQLWLWAPHTEAWLSQANHIFNRLQITSNFENYFTLDVISFELTISATTINPPKGFLFLCPPKDFQTGPLTFRWPDCPAYWSLDPSGVECLSMDDAVGLGFPSIKPSLCIRGRSWDPIVYAGLRKFHEAKGFDPDSLDVAQNLEHPIYQLPGDVDAPFAHVNEEEVPTDPQDLDHVNSHDGPEDMQTSASKNIVLSLHQLPPDCSSTIGTRKIMDPAPPLTKGEEARSPQDRMRVSGTFEVLMKFQLALILYLALSSLYENVFC